MYSIRIGQGVKLSSLSGYTGSGVNVVSGTVAKILHSWTFTTIDTVCDEISQTCLDNTDKAKSMY